MGHQEDKEGMRLGKGVKKGGKGNLASEQEFLQVLRTSHFFLSNTKRTLGEGHAQRCDSAEPEGLQTLMIPTTSQP